MKWAVLATITLFLLYFGHRAEAVVRYFIRHLRRISLELGDPEIKYPDPPEPPEFPKKLEPPKEPLPKPQEFEKPVKKVRKRRKK